MKLLGSETVTANTTAAAITLAVAPPDYTGVHNGRTYYDLVVHNQGAVDASLVQAADAGAHSAMRILPGERIAFEDLEGPLYLYAASSCSCRVSVSRGPR